MGTACVQWLVPLDTLGYRHMSKIGHVSALQHVQWNWLLDTSATLIVFASLWCNSFSKTIIDQYILIITIKNVSMHIYTRIFPPMSLKKRTILITSRKCYCTMFLSNHFFQ